MIRSLSQQNLHNLERRCWQLHSFLGFLQSINGRSGDEIERVNRLQQESDRLKYDLLTAELEQRLDALASD